jgi:hypothetical protein
MGIWVLMDLWTLRRRRQAMSNLKRRRPPANEDPYFRSKALQNLMVEVANV